MLCALLLIAMFHYDLRFDKSVDLDYYRSYPLVNKVVSTAKETVKILTPALLLGYLVLLAWPGVATRFGWAAFLSPLPSEGKELLRVLLTSPRHPYWAMVFGCALVITTGKALRCWGAPREGNYYLFISYRTTDSTVARQVTERLIASGVKVWFAEYELLVKEQLMMRRASEQARDAFIHKVLLQGMNGSTHGLALTNDSYAESVWCGMEIRHLLSRHAPDRLFEVMIPHEHMPHQRFPGLLRCPGMEFRGNVDEVLTFLAGRTGWNLDGNGAGEPASAGAMYQGMCMGRPYTLDVSGWELTDAGGPFWGQAAHKAPNLAAALRAACSR